SHLGRWSRWRVRWHLEQDLHNLGPQARFPPALIATGNRRPGTEAFGQFPPGCARPCDPQHAFHDQAMVDGRSARGRLLWGQEGTQLLPTGVAEGRQSWDRQGCWWLAGDRRGLEGTPPSMTALRSRLMLAPKP